MNVSTSSLLLALTMQALLVDGRMLRGVDCNGNGVDDASDLHPKHLNLLWAPSYSVGKGASSLVSSDLNGDGSPDLATVDFLSNSVSILINHGDGAFQVAVRYLAGDGDTPRLLIAADLNGDPFPDLVTANDGCIECISPRASNVSILLNNGNGTFQAAALYAISGRSRSLVALDFNGDGAQDLATASPLEGSVSILFNKGDGTYSQNVSYPAGDVVSPLVASDLSGDGLPDLATVRSGCLDCVPQKARSVSILLNHGDGSFQGNAFYVDIDAPLFMLSSDLNSDGLPDLATSSYGCASCEPAVPDQVSVLLNEGRGTFHAVEHYDVGVYPKLMIAADLDEDGFADLATANEGCPAKGFGCFPLIPSNVSVLINRGNGSFEAAMSYHSGDFPRALIARDMNGDGTLDIATAGGNSEEGIRPAVSVLINKGDGTFYVGGRFTIGNSDPNAMVVSDVNGDGTPDVAATSYDSSAVSVLLNQTAAPTSVDVNRNDIPDECEDGAFHRGDPNNDGVVNIVDSISLLNYLFRTTVDTPRCKSSGDSNGDGVLNISDAIFILGYLFLGRSPPVAPGPPPASCGLNAPELIDLGCVTYDHCFR